MHQNNKNFGAEIHQSHTKYNETVTISTSEENTSNINTITK